MVTSALPASRGKGRFPISKACTGPRPPAFSRTSRCHCPFQLTIQCLSFSPYSPSLSLPLSPSPSCNYSLVHSTLKTLLHCPLKLFNLKNPAPLPPQVHSPRKLPPDFSLFVLFEEALSSRVISSLGIIFPFSHPVPAPLSHSASCQ